MLSLARTHKLAPRKRHVLPPNFWSKVDRSGGEGSCWEWTRALSTGGYGKFGRKGKVHHAHRVVLQFVTQREGEDLLATHGPCHNRACVNPKHLHWQTYKGNAADRLRDDTHTRGERHGLNRLSEKEVLAIRADPRSTRQVAADYKVHHITVSNIRTRRTWKWLA